MSFLNQKLTRSGVAAFIAGLFLATGVSFGASQYVKTSVLDATAREFESVTDADDVPVVEEPDEFEFVLDTSSEAALKAQLAEYQNLVKGSTKDANELKGLVKDLEKISDKSCTKATCAKALKVLAEAEDLGVVNVSDVKSLQSKTKGLSKKKNLTDFNKELSSLADDAVISLQSKLTNKQADLDNYKGALAEIQKAISQLKPKKVLKEKVKKTVEPKVKKSMKKNVDLDEEVKKPVKKNLKDQDEDEDTKKDLKKPLKKPELKKPMKEVEEEEFEEDEADTFEDTADEEESDGEEGDTVEGEFVF